MDSRTQNTTKMQNILRNAGNTEGFLELSMILSRKKSYLGIFHRMSFLPPHGLS